MIMGWKTRTILMLSLFVFWPFNILFASWPSIKAIDLRDGSIYKKNKTISIMPHEIVGLEIVGSFRNDSNDSINVCLMKKEHTIIPDYVEFWRDSCMSLAPGRDTSISTICYIRPLPFSVNESFHVRAKSSFKDDQLRSSLNIYILIDKKKKQYYDHPIINPEPPFSNGLTNTVYWQPVQNSDITIQDVYCFDREDRENLVESVKRIYRTSKIDSVKESVFEGLVNGHTYGYFVKAVYEEDNKIIPLYSDIVYSTQDNNPPHNVEVIQALPVPGKDGNVEVSWETVTDELSGVNLYRIYRAVDTGHEQKVDSIIVESIKSFESWIDTNVDSGITYYYRVRAVDKVGNEGDGIRSNGIFLNNEGEIFPLLDDGSEEDEISYSIPDSLFFKKGAKDTLWVKFDGMENAFRFRAVRDSIDYFESPPSVGMRYFDSDWIVPDTLLAWEWVNNTSYPDSVFFVFDYAKSQEISIDPNFVNGHTYFRQAIKKYPTDIERTIQLTKRIPDCFPPGDIRNLRVEAIIGDPDFQNPVLGYTYWYTELSWKPAMDGASGLRRYHIFRKVEGVDSDFQELYISPPNYVQTSFRDSLNFGSGVVTNPLIYYRVTAEDNVGNFRKKVETEWQVYERSLEAPILSFEGKSVYPSGTDTVFSEKDTVLIRLINFETTDVLSYIVSVNGKEQIHRMDDKDVLIVGLPDVEISQIKVRALYLGKRSSIWSSSTSIVRTLNEPPRNFEVWNDSIYWGGHVYLQWIRPTLDVASYEVWRWDGTGDSVLVGVVMSREDTVQWTDYYGINELTDEPGDTLEAYRTYTYRIRKVDIFGRRSIFSNAASTYCNRPPYIISHKIYNIRNEIYTISLCWHGVKSILVKTDFDTKIKIFEDDLNNLIKTEIIRDSDTCYTYFNAVPGHNYIFQIKEIPNILKMKSSSWSKPYTVSLNNLSLIILPQPAGRIFINWEDSALVNKLQVDSFKVCRNDSCWKVPGTIVSLMDSTNLEHGQMYHYSVFALDSLQQIVAANSDTTIADSGSVFIPEVLPFLNRYFNSDSIVVQWIWRNTDGLPLENSTRGAEILIIQVSVSKTFPIDTSQTRVYTLGADPHRRVLKLPIPYALNRTNEKLYFRITAKDKWKHPYDDIWSTDFYEIKYVIYDPIFPRPVKSLDISSIKAYFVSSNTVMVGLQWSGRGVQWPDSSEMYWDQLIANVAKYFVERKSDAEDWKKIAEVKVDTDSNLYTVSDTVINKTYRWRITAEDSAGNKTPSDWIEPVYLVQSPDPPNPIKYKECIIIPIELDSVEYFTEIAMDSRHFLWAYELDMMDRILCRNGWIEADTFVCKSGWGSIVIDTTWFRVKARRILQNGIWESGWSDIVYYTERDERRNRESIDIITEKPKNFKVFPNFPNPFNAGTVFTYQLPEPAFVNIRVYNIRGALVRKLVEDNKAAGYHSVVWDGTDDRGLSNSSGFYFVNVCIESENGTIFQRRMKVMFIK